MRLVDAGVTVKDRILLHLLDYWGQMHRAEWPEALTQDGIAGVIGVSRSHVAVTLPDLVKDDMVEPSTQRVSGRSRRVKVYTLTYRGGAHAGVLAQRLLRSQVTAVDASGQWDLPLDGLIQVHKVHMLSALRLLDDENRVDLREARELVRATAEVVAEGVEAEGVEAAEVWVEGVAADESEPVEPVEVGAVPQAAGETPPAPSAIGPTVHRITTGRTEEAAAGFQVPVATGLEPAPPQAYAGTPGGTAGPPVHGPGRAWEPRVDYTPHVQQQAYWWSPLRFGTGRRPSVASVGAMLVIGFLCLASAVAFFGVEPIVCLVAWLPLGLFGSFFAYSGALNLWAVGERREAWTAAAISSYTFIGVIMLAFAAFGWDVVVDLLWSGAILGLPTAVMAAGTGRNVERRGSFMLLLGPVMVLAALSMAVIDPGDVGRTGAMPVLIISVGVGWSFVGYVMVRPLGGVDGTRLVVAGGSIGLAIAVLAGAGNLASEGELGGVMAVAMVCWAAGAAYLAAVSLLPSMAHLRPDARTAYTATALAGSAALLVASAIFVWGGVYSVAVMEAVIAVGMLFLVAPELRGSSRASTVLSSLGVVMATATVMAVSVGL